jgi:6-pyruvoyltetrahydropterin/6-carboxytetrahydropterin synthase
VFEVSVEAEFCAAHALMLRGVREPVHGHTWRVRAVVSGRRLDADGLLCDFHEVERALGAVLSPWRDRNLNEVAPFAGPEGVNPSAENVAAYVADELSRRLLPMLFGGMCVSSVTVTEAPGCAATFRPPPSSNET